MLAAQQVPETTIALVTAVVVSPLFWGFLISPMLDVRFSRCWYAAVFSALAAALIGVSVMNVHHLLVFEVAATAGNASINLAYGALGGWLSNVSRKEDENRLSAWLTAANIGGGGIMGILGAELIDHLPLPVAALLLGGIVMLPTLVFLWMPAPGPDRRLAGESFRAFSADVFALLRRPEVLIALALFLAPCGTFSLTNILGGLGDDFHASQRVVSVLGGSGMMAAGICGSMLLPVLAKRLPLRPLYIAIGAVGGVFTLCLILLPRTPGSFAVAMIGENVLQSLEIACSVAIAFETIGRDNPLAATTFTLASAAYALPIVYMPIVDGWGYGRAGVAGSFAIDGILGILACLLLGLMLFLLRSFGGGWGEVEHEVMERSALDGCSS
jgi:PAT family beta-lactamase induction signal transducer AmpG